MGTIVGMAAETTEAPAASDERAGTVEAPETEVEAAETTEAPAAKPTRKRGTHAKSEDGEE